MNSYICSGAQVHSHYVTHLLCESSNNKSNNKITLMMRKILLFTLFKAEKSTHTHKIYTSLSNLVFGLRSCHISFISSGCLVVNGRYCQNVRIAFVRIFNNPGHDRERPRERERLVERVSCPLPYNLWHIKNLSKFICFLINGKSNRCGRFGRW